MRGSASDDKDDDNEVNSDDLFCWLQLIYFRAWLSTVPSTLSGLNASLLVRDTKSKRLRVNYDPRIREMLHEAEYLMKLNLEIGSLALNLCMDEDRLKTTKDKSVRHARRDFNYSKHIREGQEYCPPSSSSCVFLCRKLFKNKMPRCRRDNRAMRPI